MHLQLMPILVAKVHCFLLEFDVIEQLDNVRWIKIAKAFQSSAIVSLADASDLACREI